MYKASNFFTSQPALVTVLSDYSHPSEHDGFFIVVFVSIFLMASDAEHLFMSLLTICIFHLEKCLFKSFAYLITGLFVIQFHYLVLFRVLTLFFSNC